MYNHIQFKSRKKQYTTKKKYRTNVQVSEEMAANKQKIMMRRYPYMPSMTLIC